MARFYRLCVDIDHAAQVTGASYEVHEGREVLTYATVLVGPFTTRQEALDEALRAVVERWGVQLPLPF